MKISVEREKILEAVNHLSRIVTAKTSLPVLEGILLSLNFEYLLPYSTNFLHVNIRSYKFLNRGNSTLILLFSAFVQLHFSSDYPY